MLYLLAEEQNNIDYFKDKIEGEKTRIRRDFDNLQREATHLFDDLRLSLQNELDQIYTEFLRGYNMFKQHIVSLRENRKSLNADSTLDAHPLNNLGISRYASSNRDILQDIERDSHFLKAQQLEAQIYDLHKDKMGTLKAISAQLIKMGAIETQYYREATAAHMLKRVLDTVRTELRAVYGDVKTDYVVCLPTTFTDIEKGNYPNSILQDVQEDHKKEFN